MRDGISHDFANSAQGAARSRSVVKLDLIKEAQHGKSHLLQQRSTRHVLVSRIP